MPTLPVMTCMPCSLRAAVLAAALPAALSLALLGPAAGKSGPETDAGQAAQSQQPGGETEDHGTNVHHHKFDLIDGTPTSLGAYAGKVVLIVNTASRCGLTPQYEGLEALYKAHKDDGLVIIGFPANNFMGQEPGSNAEIAQFCRERYEVSFPMAAKISVKGKDAHPLYKQLAGLGEPLGGEPEWNFTKFLVDQDGEVVGRFGPRVKPVDPAIVKKIQEVLDAD